MFQDNQVKQGDPDQQFNQQQQQFNNQQQAGVVVQGQPMNMPPQQIQYQQQQQYAMPMAVQIIPQQQPQLSPQIQEIIFPFTQLRGRLNCWMYAVIVLFMLSIQNFRLISGDHWYIGLLVYLLQMGDYITWLIGINYGRKATNDYYLDYFPQMVQYIKISLFCASLNTFINLILMFIYNEMIWYIIMMAMCVFYVGFALVRQNYFINPGQYLIVRIEALSQQHPPQAGQNSLPMILRQFTGPGYA